MHSAMSLIERINSELITVLSGGKRTSAGQTGGLASAGSAASINLAQGLDELRSAFSASYERMSEAHSLFVSVQSTLQQLADAAGGLVELARQAAAPDDSVNRASLETRFRDLIFEFRKIQDEAVQAGFDSLDKNDIAAALAESGVNLQAATGLAQAFRRLAPVDGELGYSAVLQAVAIDGGTAVVSPRDPLDNHLRSQVEAEAALDQLLRFKSDIENDLKNATAIAQELLGAQQFALAGYSASGTVAARLTSSADAQTVAQDLINEIRKTARDNSLSAHSAIDRELASELLSE